MKRTTKLMLALLLGLFINLGSAQLTEETTQIGLELVAEGLTAPVALVPAPDDSGRLFVVDQIGLIYIIGPDGEMMDEPFLDLRDRIVELEPEYDERGLLGLDFHPDYAENGRFFVYYSAPLREGAPEGWNHTSHVSEFRVSDNANQADAASETILMRIDEPQLNHNAGQLTFGPDGLLYIPVGDGGGANDEDMGHVDDWFETNDGGNGQDLATNLLGTILRIDVDNEENGLPYAIPDDNPFVNQAGAEPVYAYGLRNPWRISFDMETGDLYAGDLGQELFEEVDLIVKGGNYGWNVKEATHCFSTQTPEEPPTECPQAGPDGEAFVAPVLEQDHSYGNAIIGGYVYRGNILPQLAGNYVFGDHALPDQEHSGVLYMATPSEDGLWEFQQLFIEGNENGTLEPERRLLSFGEANDGELYVLTKATEGPKGNTGEVSRIVAGQ